MFQPNCLPGRIGRALATLALLLVALPLVVLSSPVHPVAAQVVERSVSSDGIIAYATADHAIWVSAPDGSNARKLWEIPQDERGNMVSGITELTWRQDGAVLAFVSGHEPQCSLYETNIYVVNVDGSGFRRITNRPTCTEANTRPTGTVTVEIRNDDADLQIAEIAVEGALNPTFVSLLPKQTKQVTISNVPDLGAGVHQAVIAIQGNYRWFVPGADVVAGQTVDAGVLAVSSATRISTIKAWSPTWSTDGQALGFLLGLGIMQQAPLEAGVLQRSTDLLSGNAQTVTASELAWSPVDDTVLLTASKVEGGRGVFRATVGSNEPPALVVSVDDTRGLAWLPDGSGFVLANYFEDLFTPINSNLWHIDLVSEQATQLTTFGNEFALEPAVSPDGSRIAFNYAPNLEPETPSQIRIMALGGGESVLFGPEKIGYAAWAPAGAVVTPTPEPTITPDPTTPDPTTTPEPPAPRPNPATLDFQIFLPQTSR